MADKFLELFGSICGGRTRAYGSVEAGKLPEETRRLLRAYTFVLIGMTCVALLLFVHLRFWSLAFGVPLLAGGWVLKGHFEKRLDPLLAPYITNKKP